MGHRGKEVEVCCSTESTDVLNVASLFFGY